MSDAYRSSAFPCPVCEHSTLRVFKDRLVCDECQGMQLTNDDFADSIREIDGSKDALEIVDRTATEQRCPQCSVAMHACKVTLGSLEIRGNILHCATHGVWIPRKAMTAAFARASRRGGFAGLGATSGTQSRFGSGSGVDTASIVNNMPSGHSGMSGAMAGIASAFGSGVSASSGLAISHWQARRPRAHTIYVSAHKDQSLECPSCKTALAYWGDRWRCETCPGLFVETAALLAMIREILNGPWEMPPHDGKAGERVCPICADAMIIEVLEGVTIDRCRAEHGVWFDENELEQVLHQVQMPHGGLGAWIKRLFARSG